MEDNRKLAEKTHNTLTQTITESGQLVDVETIVDKITGETRKLHTLGHQLKQDGVNDADIPENIEQHIFDTSNVVFGKTDHGQSRLVSGPFAPATTDTSSASAI